MVAEHGFRIVSMVAEHGYEKKSRIWHLVMVEELGFSQKKGNSRHSSRAWFRPKKIEFCIW